MVIADALILHHRPLVKAPVGIQGGRIAGIGKAGRPDTRPGVDVVIGPPTGAIAGEGKILTAGGFDCRIRALPRNEVDAEACQVRADADLPICGPAALPLAQRRFLD